MPGTRPQLEDRHAERVAKVGEPGSEETNHLDTIWRRSTAACHRCIRGSKPLIRIKFRCAYPRYPISTSSKIPSEGSILSCSFLLPPHYYPTPSCQQPAWPHLQFQYPRLTPSCPFQSMRKNGRGSMITNPWLSYTQNFGGLVWQRKRKRGAPSNSRLFVSTRAKTMTSDQVAMSSTLTIKPSGSKDSGYV